MRVVLAPRRWCQVCEKERRRRWPKSPEHRGERAIIRKTIAWGMPGDSGVTCMLVCAFYYPFAHETSGRIGRPAFPAPFVCRGREINEYLAQKPCGEIAEVCLNVIASAAKQSIAQQKKVRWIASLRSQ